MDLNSEQSLTRASLACIIGKRDRPSIAYMANTRTRSRKIKSPVESLQFRETSSENLFEKIILRPTDLIVVHAKLQWQLPFYDGYATSKDLLHFPGSVLLMSSDWSEHHKTHIWKCMHMGTEQVFYCRSDELKFMSTYGQIVTSE